ncbi:hypothetical protein F4861DRAFT_189523 [Xylaria intraflava]|nr:hypothetical protein F4861DRAFT_189523 [Xylaria intraflava]
MASLADGFPQFPRLPTELRDQIWRYAFPEPRTYEVLDAPRYSPMSRQGPSAKVIFADIRNEPLPALARVCRDARQAVLRRYKPIALSGVVKHINLDRDIILLDSYLQVRRLLKVVRLLSQIESVRRNATRIALGTSWGIHSGLHLRIFHKAVRTKQNMARLLGYLSKFPRLEEIILIVCQRSTFNVPFPQPNHTPWDHHFLWETYNSPYYINFILDNHGLHKPSQSKLVPYDAESQKTEKSTISTSTSKCSYRDPHPRGHQVQDLKVMFENSLRSVVEKNSSLPDSYEPPRLETATLVWIYGVGRRRFS